ncbi:MAG TPA: dihydrodipicolinate synthase family protein [Blastocatellia bacterium]|nr:dihydrodipicolinate synthase family protein [Blastocatellia bacterium]
MYTLQTYRPKRGLSVPTITVLDDAGRILESDQRRVFRYVVQGGYGADIIFGVGTNGEWNRLTNDQRQAVMAIESEEVRRINQHLQQHGHSPVEAWVGITGTTRAETLANLEVALDLGADAGVIAPLSIRDLDDVVRFFQRDVVALFERKGKLLPLFLYDNADIAINPQVPHIRTRDVKRLSRLEFICGMKVSAPRKVLGHYTKASLHFNEKDEFGIYVGQASLIFDLFQPTRGLLGKIREYWNLYLLHHAMPIGVVSGPANVFPREWQKAWRVCYAGDEEAMHRYRNLLESFRNTYTFTQRGRKVSKLIACLKYALLLDGVISSPAVAPGTPSLTEEEKRIFAERYYRLKEEIRAHSDPLWVSRWEEAPVSSPEISAARNGSRESR